MRYQVRFVENAAMPTDVEWAFARQAEDTFLFVKESAIDVTTGRCDALSRAWQVWQDAEAQSIALGLRSWATPLSA